MAATTGILFAVGSSAYQAIDANQRRQKAKGDAAAIARSAPDPAAEQIKANSAALNAQTLAKKRAAHANGRASTILTGPSGITTAPPVATKTLLGL
jgi:hypothetical protein